MLGRKKKTKHRKTINETHDECNINYILKMINKNINIYIFGENNQQFTFVFH